MALTPTQLRCEYRTDPLGIDVRRPRLSWIAASPERGAAQSAYQVRVASSPEKLARDDADLWDSDKITSGQSIQIEYAGQSLDSRTWCHWQVRLWDTHDRASAWSAPATWSVGLLHPDDWRAKWIGLEEPLAPKPPDSAELNPSVGDREKILATPRYLRREFMVGGPVRRAVIHVTALGVYELRLNGNRVGDHLLAPEWTNYAKRVQVQTYDVTALLAIGGNAIAATLGNGWYCGLWQHWPYTVRMYGDEPLLFAQLEIELADGGRQTVVSDPSWHGSLDGPIRFSGIYEGEVYDARKEMPGWDGPGFVPAGWTPVKERRNLTVGALVWQRSEPIRVTRELAPVAVTEPTPGVYVFDLGQNMAGWCRCEFLGGAGQTITLQHGELLSPDGTVFIDNLHLFNHADRQLDRYTFRGDGMETFAPRFTYHGFRYVEVRGLTGRPAVSALTGIVFNSDCPETGEFSCSDPLVTKLARNILRSQRANFMGVPTDCPQRDERCGYTGDAQFFMPTAVYFMDVAAFFNKCLVDLCADSAHPVSGAFGDHMPDFAAGGYGHVGWGDAGIICPYVYYQTYGDTRVVQEHYEAMRGHLEFWISRILPGEEADSGVRDSGGPGDWLNLNCPTKSEVIATAYYSYLAGLMSEMAAAIGRDADACRYGERSRQARDAFARRFIAEDGGILESSQTGYALAFTMGLVPPAKHALMAARFADEIGRHDWHLATGFIGTPRLLPGLHAAGRDDIAHRLLLETTKPSWLYPVTLGATSIWERWDGWDGGAPEGGMNSLNHYAFGSVGAYLFEQVGGIRAAAPGYKKILIQPVIGLGLDWAKTHYDSIHGRIVSHWKLDDSSLTMKIAIPANATAEAYIPTSQPETITESGSPAAMAAGVKWLRNEPRATVYALESGTYNFVAAIP